MQVRNEKWSEDEFTEYLEGIRSWYRTGLDVDLDEAVDYLKRLPQEMNVVRLLERARGEGRTLIGNRFGFATIEETLAMAHYIRDNGGCDLFGITADTYTRRAEFAAAEAAIEESKKRGISLLNGFPVSIYGVKPTRRLYETCGAPVSSRYGAGTPQFHYLIALAAGSTEANNGPIMNCVDYAHVTPEEALVNTQFLDRMIGWYEERGVSISKQQVRSGGTFFPPCLAVATLVIEMLLAAEQGVKNHDLMPSVQHSITQDVAMLRVVARLGKEYLKARGYEGNVFTSANTYREASPPDQARCLSDILFCVLAARWGGATRIMVKSADEGLGIPSKEGQAMAMRGARSMLTLMTDSQYPESQELETESSLIELGARAILDRVFELGEGDLAVGAMKGLESGVLDYPFAPSKHALGKVMVARDSSAAVRFLSPGNLPVPREVLEYDAEKLAKRREAVKNDYDLIVEDILRAPAI